MFVSGQDFADIHDLALFHYTVHAPKPRWRLLPFWARFYGLWRQHRPAGTGPCLVCGSRRDQGRYTETLSPKDDLAVMSSGFVSGGTIDEPAERDDEWLRVQRDLEEERRRKAEIGKQDGGKSLYEVLQQNKSESAIDSLLLRSPICSSI